MEEDPKTSAAAADPGGPAGASTAGVRADSGRTTDGTAAGTAEEEIFEDEGSPYSFIVSFVLPRKLQAENAPIALPGSNICVRCACLPCPL